jgi:hypothetical protein
VRRRLPSLALLAVLVSTLGTLLAVELGLRVMSGTPFSFPDPAAGALHMVGGAYPGAHDPLLGYVPNPGIAPDNVWGTAVTITEGGLRSNGEQRRPSGAAILAVGDSFTFGDEVSDRETWPARLESLLSRPVLNGGVFGYGLDQIVLRAEQLLEQTDAQTLIVSFTADDVRRCEYAYRYAWKPWFEVVDGALELRGVPVPEPGAPPPGEALWRRALRHSFLGDLVMRRLDPQGWMIPSSLRVHRQGVSVGRLLVDRLADVAAARDMTLLLVFQWHPLSKSASAMPVLERARKRRVPLLRLEPALARVIADDPQGAGAYFRIEHRPGRVVAVGHLTDLGNQLTARLIAQRLELLEGGTMPATPPAEESP